MTELAIRAEGLGKKYVIGHRSSERYGTLRDAMARAGRNAIRKARDMARGLPIIEGDELEEVWALKGVAFEIAQGEVVGIVGRNGAGKSTLLKVLSRVTEPSEGRVLLHGRVASLLEVGTGFHPELSGRENIFLNGAILGMHRAEVRRKFDAIVAFAELERFLDTPVKRYSSGMYMRLAFAVAAHLEPEILLVDEVLAVGDASFQKKCLGKIEDVSKSHGRTVLFVSHNMSAVNRLCSRAIWLSEGRVKSVGPSEAVVADYLSADGRSRGEQSWTLDKAPGNERVKLRSARVKDSSGSVSNSVDIRHPFTIEIETEIFQPTQLRVAAQLVTVEGEMAFTSVDSVDERWGDSVRPPGRYLSRCHIPGDFLNEGRYFVRASASVPFVEIFFIEESAVAFDVEQTGGVSGRYPERWPGVVCPRLDWSVTRIE